MMNQSSFTVTYIGGPTIILEIDGLRIMTDPTLDPPGGTYKAGDIVVKKLIGPTTDDIGQIDLVLLSHDQHYDNFDNAGRVIVSKATRTFTTKPGAERQKGNCIGLAPWQTTSVFTPGGTELFITATPARHGPAGTEKLQGEVIGFLLGLKDDNGQRIYITGDTVFYEGVAEVARLYQPTHVFVFAGAAEPRGPFNVTMRTNDVIDTSIAFPKATIIPLHYEGWSHLTQNYQDIERSFDLLGLTSRLKVLRPGESAVLG